MSKQPRFADLAYLTDREVQTLLREVDSKDCVIGLKGASKAVAMRFLCNMSDRVSGFIREEMGAVTPTQEEIDSAHARILQQVTQLASQGQITWPPGKRAAKAKPFQPSKVYLARKQAAKEALKHPLSELSFQEIDTLMASLAEVSRCEGILTMGKLLPARMSEARSESGEDLLGYGLLLVLDGTEPAVIRSLMEHLTESLLRAQERKCRKAIEGLVSLQNGDSPRMVGRRLGVIY